MSRPFIMHIIITGSIFYLLASGQKFFLKLKGTIDFSYLAIVIFGTYAAVLLNMHRGRGILSVMGGAFLISLPFTFLILCLSSKLDEVYFAIGTLALYMMAYQFAFNLESITGGAFGLSGMIRTFELPFSIMTLQGYLWFTIGLIAVLIVGLMFFKSTYFYTILRARGERELIITSLGVKTSVYKLVLIILTTLIAVIGGTLYAFYFLYIDPPSFWLGMLILILVISFISYQVNELGTFLIALAVIGVYEGMRFFKVVDPSQIGYMREIVFSLLIMAVSYRVFKKTNFGRET